MNEDKPSPTPSRTLRIPVSEYDTKKYNFNYTLNGNVYFLSFNTIEESVSAYSTLKNDNIPVKYHVYSLFIKFDESIDKETLEQNIKTILNNNCNITYIRVDNKENVANHTGKVVIDKYYLIVVLSTKDHIRPRDTCVNIKIHLLLIK